MVFVLFSQNTQNFPLSLNYGLWENERISFSNIIDDDGLYNNEGISMQDDNESMCKIIGGWNSHEKSC